MSSRIIARRRPARALPQLCRRHSSALPQLCQWYSSALPQICQRHSSALPQQHCRRYSTSNEYLTAYHEATHELSLLGCAPGTTDLVPYADYINAVVLPLRRTYAWGIPNAEALQAIADASPNGVTEVGSGTGYWAHLLEQHYNVPVAAYDSHPLEEDDINGFHALSTIGNVLPFMRVREGGAEAAALHPERTLLLCWPPRETDGSGTGERDVAMMAADALDGYTGRTVAYVGVYYTPETTVTAVTHDVDVSEDSGADTATTRSDTAGDTFHAALSAEFDLTREVPLPNWPPLRDTLTIWTRRGSGVGAADAPDSPITAAVADGLGSAAAQADTAVTGPRARARAAALAEVRYTKFDRPWAMSTLVRWARRRHAGEAAAESAMEIEMLRRCLSRAPWVVRMVGRTAARRLEGDF